MATQQGTELVHNNGSASPDAGTVQRDGFGETSLEVRAETAASAVAAQATAIVQARQIMALKRPRDWDEVRSRLLKECKRPGFADVARYRKPIGKGVEGPSIRFAEAAIRCMTNVVASTTTVFDDAQKRIVRVSVTDLESNVPYETDVVIEKTVERSKLSDGQTPLSVRVNSSGKKTYLVAATEDDLLNKQNALISKALRTNGLRLLPGDIFDDCMQQVFRTMDDRDAQDPDAARKKLVDAFAEVGVMPSSLKEYLGHDIATVGPAELKELRGVYTSVRDGEATWPDVLAHKTGKKGGALEEQAAAGPAPSSKVETLKQDLEKKAKRQEPSREPGSDG